MDFYTSIANREFCFTINLEEIGDFMAKFAFSKRNLSAY